MTPYELNQMCSGIKVGDKVRVTRTAEDRERGWPNIWPSGMDYMVGKEYTVRELCSYGIRLNSHSYCAFPYFVLEVVEKGD